MSEHLDKKGNRSTERWLLADLWVEGKEKRSYKFKALLMPPSAAAKADLSQTPVTMEDTNPTEELVEVRLDCLHSFEESPASMVEQGKWLLSRKVKWDRLQQVRRVELIEQKRLEVQKAKQLKEEQERERREKERERRDKEREQKQKERERKQKEKEQKLREEERENSNPEADSALEEPAAKRRRTSLRSSKAMRVPKSDDSVTTRKRKPANAPPVAASAEEPVPMDLADADEEQEPVLKDMSRALQVRWSG